MKISEFIELLEEFKNINGDLDVQFSGQYGAVEFPTKDMLSLKNHIKNICVTLPQI